MPTHVSPDNFVRAESDLYFGNIVRAGGFGTFHHFRDLGPIDSQLVVRQNRDTLYSAAVFDLDASDVTVTLPDSGRRFSSLQVITEDHYVPEVSYASGPHTYTRKQIGTRYVMLAVRTLVDPNDPADISQVHALQDAITAEQSDRGSFEVPDWDPVSQKQVRDALVELFATLPDSLGMFGTAADTDPVRRLIGSAAAWGGNPEKEALYLTVTPPQNDGSTIHRVTVTDVPVDGFWSITVYNAEGYFTPNDGSTPNCLPITPGWNYLVRLYRPRSEVLGGAWIFPTAEPV